MSAEVRLGDHVLPLVAVSIPRAKHGLAKAFDGVDLSSPDVQQANVLDVLFGAGQQVLYELLDALIPGLHERIPLWEFAGFASQAAYDAGEYDPALDKAPTSAEVQEALAATWEVSKIGRLISPVSTVVDPTLLRAIVTGMLEDVARVASSTISLSRSGGSPLTNGSSTVPEDLLSTVSTGSSRDDGKP